ncbi:MAG: hypothetical protein V4649_06820 [Bacteroidota bacterium]
MMRSLILLSLLALTGCEKKESPTSTSAKYTHKIVGNRTWTGTRVVGTYIPLRDSSFADSQTFDIIFVDHETIVDNRQHAPGQGDTLILSHYSLMPVEYMSFRTKPYNSDDYTSIDYYYLSDSITYEQVVDDQPNNKIDELHLHTIR